MEHSPRSQSLNKSYNIVSRRASRFIDMHHLQLLGIFLMSDEVHQTTILWLYQVFKYLFDGCNLKALHGRHFQDRKTSAVQGRKENPLASPMGKQRENYIHNNNINCRQEVKWSPKLKLYSSLWILDSSSTLACSSHLIFNKFLNWFTVV